MATTDKNQHWLDVVFPSGISFGDDTGGVIVPSGQSVDRPPVPQNGTIRYNTTLFILEAFVNGTWENLVEDASTSTFIGLTDTPGGYPVGQQVLRSNLAQTGLEFADGDALWLPLLGGTMGAGASVQFSGGTIKNVPSPSAAGDVANKDYVDGIAAGLAVKESVRSATTGPIDLGTQGLAGIDGHAPYTVGDRILVKDQVDPTENGVYAAQVGVWTRTLDMDGTPANEVQGGTTVFVQAGTANGNTNWTVVWTGNVAVGFDPMNWTLISAGTSQDLWQTISTDAGSQIALTPTDTLTLTGGTGISTAMAAGTVTITNDAPNVDQNLYQTFVGDSGATPVPATPTTFLNILGTGTVSTAVVGNTLTITGSGGGNVFEMIDDDGDTRIQVETSVGADEDVITFNTGDTPSGFGAVTNTMRLSSGQFTVNLGTANTIIGAPITLQAGNGGAGGYTGGAVNITAGAAGGDQNGGVVNITGGSTASTSGSSNGGNVTITGGSPGSSNANGGDVQLYGANVIAPGDGDGGDIFIQGGFNNGAAGGAGGKIGLFAGWSQGVASGGQIDIVAGSSFTAVPRVGGAVNITSGDSGGASGGDITIEAGYGLAAGARGGDVSIIGGYDRDGDGTRGGTIHLLPGRSLTGTGDGGDVNLSMSGGGTGGVTGNVNIRMESGFNAGETPALRFYDNTANNDYVGLKAPSSAVTTSVDYSLPVADGAVGFVLTTNGSGVMSWTATAATSSITDVDGDTRIRTEASADEDKIRFDTGDNVGTFGALSDAMVLSSGEFTVDLGVATTSVGAPISLTAGGGDTTKGGDLTLAAGAGSGVDGGDVIIAPGDSDIAQGGAIVLNPGDGATAGAVVVPGPTSTLSTEMRFQEASVNGALYIGFRAPADITGGAGSSTSFIWPGADGTVGQVLTTDGAGAMSWTTVVDDDQSRINDTGDTTFIDTDAVSGSITSGVVATASQAAGTPLTLNSASTLITSSAGLSGNAGAIIDINAGAGEGAGTGGAVTIDGGVGGTTGVGGTVSITAGNGGATSGDGGAINIVSGNGNDDGGDIFVQTGNGIATIGGQGGDFQLYGGTGFAGGDVNLTGGTSTSVSGGQGGGVTLIGGQNLGGGATGYGGDASLLGGYGAGTGGRCVLAGGDGGVTAGTVMVMGPNGTTAGTLRIHDNNNLNTSSYIGFTVVDDAITTSIDYQLPEAPSISGQFLASTTGGLMAWASVPYDIDGYVLGVPPLAPVWRRSIHRPFVLGPTAPAVGTAMCDSTTTATVSAGVFELHLVGPSTAAAVAPSTGVSPAVVPTATLIGTINFAVATIAATVVETFLPGGVGPTTAVPIPPGHELVLIYATADGGGTLASVSFNWSGETP